MNKLCRIITAGAVAAAIGLATVTPVEALVPTVAITTDSAPAVGHPTTFSATSDCGDQVCGYQWEVVQRNSRTHKTTRIAQLGFGSTATWTPDSTYPSYVYVIVSATACWSNPANHLVNCSTASLTFSLAA